MTGLHAFHLLVGVLLLAQAFSFLDRMIMGLLVGPIRESFQISDTQYSLLAGFAFSLFYAVMGIPLARIADAGNRRNLIAAGIAVWSAMTAICGLAKGFWSLFAARVGVGVGEATLSPAAYSMLADYFPKTSLARALSVFMLGVTFGSGAAYMLGGAVVGYVSGMDAIVLPVFGEMEGWQLTFLIVGLPGLAVSLLVMATVREPARKGVTPDAAAFPVREVAAYLWQRRRGYGSLIISVAVFVMAVYALNLWGPTYFIRTFGYDPATAGWRFGIVMIVFGSAGLLIAGTVADRLVARGMRDAYPRVVLFSMLGLAPFGVALAYVENDILALFTIGIAIFFSAFQGGLVAASLQVMTPNRMRGQVVAVYQLLANLIGLGLGPTVVALCTDYVFANDAAIGKSIALVCAVLCPLTALLLWRGLPAIRQLIETQERE
jgi:MFS family permease